MSLSLTPINEAWKNTQQKRIKSTKPKNVESQKHNIYSSPETQSKILSELGMIEHQNYEIPIETEQTQPLQVLNKNSLNLTIQRKELVEFFKPYSNEYIENIIYDCINNKKQNGLTQDLIDTIETMYIMLSLILFLMVIDILFKIKLNSK